MDPDSQKGKGLRARLGQLGLPIPDELQPSDYDPETGKRTGGLGGGGKGLKYKGTKIGPGTTVGGITIPAAPIDPKTGKPMKPGTYHTAFPNTFSHIPNLGQSQLFNNDPLTAGWDVKSSYLFGELPGYKDSSLNKAVIKNQKAAEKARIQQLTQMQRDYLKEQNKKGK